MSQNVSDPVTLDVGPLPIPGGAEAGVLVASTLKGCIAGIAARRSSGRFRVRGPLQGDVS